MPSQSSKSLGKDGLKPWLSHAQQEFQEPGEGRAEALAIPCPARVQGAWGRTGLSLGYPMPSQSPRSLGKDGLKPWLSHAQPDQSSKSLGKDGLKPWLSHAQTEFKEPGEGRAEALAIPCPARVPRACGRTGCSADCLMPSQSSKSLWKDGLQC
uniref:Uncharacterized protein n=1 Tax=Xenopus tropicalis TaxID=8364 RepID=A0A1B8Y2J3_XENTR